MTNQILIEKIKKLHNIIWKDLAQSGKTKSSVRHYIISFMVNIIQDNLDSDQILALKRMEESLEPACAENFLLDNCDCSKCRLAIPFNKDDKSIGCMDPTSFYFKWFLADQYSMSKKMTAAKIVLLWR